MTMNRIFVQSATGDTGNAAQPFDYAAAAAEVNKALDTIEAIVPKFLAAQENSTEFVRRRRHIPLPLVQKAVAAAEQYQTLHPLFEVAEARKALDFENYFRPIQTRLQAGARDLGFSLDGNLMALGNITRQFYVVAKNVAARMAGSERLAEYVESMKELLPQANRNLSPEKAAAKAARAAARADAKAAKAKEKAAAKAAKAKGTIPAAAALPGPM